MSFLFIGKEQCEAKREQLKKLTVKPVKNTMKLHAVIGISTSELIIKHTSCYCSDCIRRDYCNAWSKVTLSAANHSVIPETQDETPYDSNEAQTNGGDNILVSFNPFVT